MALGDIHLRFAWQALHLLAHTHNFVTHYLSHTTFTFTHISMSHTHNFVTHHLSHTQHVTHTQLCQKEHLSHTHLCHTHTHATLSHTHTHLG